MQNTRRSKWWVVYIYIFFYNRGAQILQIVQYMSCIGSMFESFTGNQKFRANIHAAYLSVRTFRLINSTCLNELIQPWNIFFSLQVSCEIRTFFIDSDVTSRPLSTGSYWLGVKARNRSFCFHNNMFKLSAIKKANRYERDIPITDSQFYP